MLEKKKEIWDQVSNINKIAFDCEPVCNKKYLSPKLKYMKENSMQTFMVRKCQNEAFIVFAFLRYQTIVYLERVKYYFPQA